MLSESISLVGLYSDNQSKLIFIPSGAVAVLTAVKGIESTARITNIDSLG